MRASLSALATAAAGMLASSIGDGTNQLAIFFNNQRMPVRYLGCAVDPGVINDGRHACMTAASHLKFLCDVLPLGHTIYSIGDFGLMFGGLLLIPALTVYGYTVIKQLHKRFAL